MFEFPHATLRIDVRSVNGVGMSANAYTCCVKPDHSPPILRCPLCASAEADLLFRSVRKNLEREYLRCGACDLVFVPRKFHLDEDAARARYLSHDNDPSNADYRRFLSRLWDELRPRLRRGARGLDYSAGPGPALAVMIEEAGFSASVYDPIFHPNQRALSGTYDFITCTETAEHFAKPRADFLQLDRMLARGAWLGVMTETLDDWSRFADWYYHHDPTHVAFYSSRTFQWITSWLGWKVEFPRDRVILFQKCGERMERGDSISSDPLV